MAKRGRKPSRPAEIVGPDIVTATPPDLAEEERRRNLELKELARQWAADLGEYDCDRYVDEARFFVGHSQMALFELGRRLIVLREREGYGQWGAICDRIGIDRNTGFRIVQATVKLGARRSVDATGINWNFSRGKLLALAVAEDELLDDLEQGKSVTGLTLDDVERMSVAEVRAAVRRERQARREEREALERQLEDKNKKIDELDRALARRESSPRHERERELVRQIHEEAHRVSGAMLGLRIKFKAMHDEDLVSDATMGASREALLYAMRLLLDLRGDYGIEGADLEDACYPEWMLGDEVIAKAIEHRQARDQARAETLAARRAQKAGGGRTEH